VVAADSCRSAIISGGSALGAGENRLSDDDSVHSLNSGVPVSEASFHSSASTVSESEADDPPDEYLGLGWYPSRDFTKKVWHWGRY
jgi:hypothetical protein